MSALASLVGGSMQKMHTKTERETLCWDLLKIMKTLPSSCRECSSHLSTSVPSEKKVQVHIGRTYCLTLFEVILCLDRGLGSFLDLVQFIQSHSKSCSLEPCLDTFHMEGEYSFRDPYVLLIVQTTLYMADL